MEDGAEILLPIIYIYHSRKQQMSKQMNKKEIKHSQWKPEKSRIWSIPVNSMNLINEYVYDGNKEIVIANKKLQKPI